MSTLELTQRLLQFKHKLNMHYAYRNSANVDNRYVLYLEKNINEIKDMLKQKDFEQRKVA